MPMLEKADHVLRSNSLVLKKNHLFSQIDLRHRYSVTMQIGSETFCIWLNVEYTINPAGYGVTRATVAGECCGIERGSD